MSHFLLQKLGRNFGVLVSSSDSSVEFMPPDSPCTREPATVSQLHSARTWVHRRPRGIAWGLGIKEYTMSPSFVIVRELYGRLPLYHIDLYRLNHLEEIVEVGLDDYLYGNGVCVVEWAEKGLSVLPTEHLLIEISHLADTERSFQLKPSGKRYLEIAAQLKASPNS